jgi:imidazolonepropionase-like amidohydrolase
MFLLVFTLLARLLAPAAEPARETEEFRLYKFQQPIGVELANRVTRADGSAEIRTNFSFTDRGATVPLAATLTLAKDGSIEHFQAWGSTSRFTQVDDRISVREGTATIEREGKVTKNPTPALFFTADAYAPVVVTEQMWRYWSTHGRPARLALLPSGSVSFETRGEEEITDDAGRRVKLERFALTGLEWGRETIWFDSQGRLAGLKSVDAEFDHFEATRSDYSQALNTFVASAAADGMASLREVSRSTLAAPDEPRPVAYVGATLIDATGAPAIPDAVVLVSRGRIAAAGARSSVAIPADARRVDVAGKTILPGLWDMHAHFEQVEWGPLYLAAGVTTVRDCGNELDFIRAVRDTIDDGRGLGPSILMACIVDGEGKTALGTTRLTDASGIPGLIQTFRDARCSQVKIYSSLPPRLIAPLASAAHEAGLSVTGHIPNGIGAVHAVEAGMDQINHLSYVVRALFPPSYDPDVNLPRPVAMKATSEIDLTSASARATIDFFKRRNVTIDPTMALTELGTHTPQENAANEPGLAKVAEPLRRPLGSFGVSPESSSRAQETWRTNLAVLRALHQTGVTIVAGTDQAVPGFSLHREMEIYVSAGFTPMEAIQAATIVPARVMRRDKDVGTIEAGKSADLIVVDGDPLADIRSLRRVVTVIKAGRAYDTASLWRLVGFQQ